MSAIQKLLAGMFDYAGLYPPASLSLRTAADNYLEYTNSKHASLLGRFIINADRLEELRSTVDENALKRFKLSVIVSDLSALDLVMREIDRVATPRSLIETVELKCANREAVQQTALQSPSAIAKYCEIPLDSHGEDALNAIAAASIRAKIRMGGVVPEAFPSVPAVVRMLKMLADQRIPFKATAGLHHPIRSSQPLTYEPQSLRAVMHGFLNLCGAAAVLYFGGAERDAQEIMQDEDPSAWHIEQDSVRWRHLNWTADQLATLRSQFFISIGSCSFEEPVRDLEALGWL